MLLFIGTTKAKNHQKNEIPLKTGRFHEKIFSMPMFS